MKKLIFILSFTFCLILGSCNPYRMVVKENAKSYNKEFKKQSPNEYGFSSCELKDNDMIWTVDPNSNFGKELLALPENERAAALNQFFIQLYNSSTNHQNILAVMKYEGIKFKVALPDPKNNLTKYYTFYPNGI